MNTPTEKGQGYTAKEQELIRQLIQARMEQQSELGYEDLEGYELPPRTQFSMLNLNQLSLALYYCTYKI